MDNVYLPIAIAVAIILAALLILRMIYSRRVKSWPWARKESYEYICIAAWKETKWKTTLFGNEKITYQCYAIMARKNKKDCFKSKEEIFKTVELFHEGQKFPAINKNAKED